MLANESAQIKTLIMKLPKTRMAKLNLMVTPLQIRINPKQTGKINTKLRHLCKNLQPSFSFQFQKHFAPSSAYLKTKKNSRQIKSWSNSKNSKKKHVKSQLTIEKKLIKNSKRNKYEKL